MINIINNTINKDDLVKIGYKEYTAISIIRQAKQNMVKKGYSFYNNKRLGRVPITAVETILGFSLQSFNTLEEK